jgi:tRNA wybutosine-synthesizing protein 4
MSDRAIRATNDEAFAAKVSAVSRGYFQDPYVRALGEATAPGLAQAPPTRQPMINRGTFARVTFVRRCVASFLAAAPPGGPAPQVVSFGAGFDTLPFLLVAAAPRSRPLRYVELDFQPLVRAKADAVAATPALAALFERAVRAADGGIAAAAADGSAYTVAPCDLRDTGRVREVLRGAGLDAAAPTVFISECVLVYMEPAASDALIRMAASEFTGLRAFVNYEPVEPGDAFGEQMVKNVAMRGSPLVGIHRYPTVEAQRRRFADAGWAHVDAMSMLDALTGLLDEAEVKRINRIEMLDELEEFRLMMEHYSFVWARAAPEGREQALAGLRLHGRPPG